MLEVDGRGREGSWIDLEVRTSRGRCGPAALAASAITAFISTLGNGYFIDIIDKTKNSGTSIPRHRRSFPNRRRSGSCIRGLRIGSCGWLIQGKQWKSICIVHYKDIIIGWRATNPLLRSDTWALRWGRRWTRRRKRSNRRLIF